MARIIRAEIFNPREIAVLHLCARNSGTGTLLFVALPTVGGDGCRVGFCSNSSIC